jgi:hypothetical protein
MPEKMGLKRQVYISMLAGMLIILAFPVSFTRAATSTVTKTPFDWLTPEEQAYITDIRAADDVLQSACARMTALLWGYQATTEWTDKFNAEQTMINTAVLGIYHKPAPPEFAGVAREYDSITNGLYRDELFKTNSYANDNLYALIIDLSESEKWLDSKIELLQRARNNMEARIIEVANKRILYGGGSTLATDSARSNSCSLFNGSASSKATTPAKTSLTAAGPATTAATVSSARTTAVTSASSATTVKLPTFTEGDLTAPGSTWVLDKSLSGVYNRIDARGMYGYFSQRTGTDQWVDINLKVMYVVDARQTSAQQAQEETGWRLTPEWVQSLSDNKAVYEVYEAKLEPLRKTLFYRSVATEIYWGYCVNRIDDHYIVSISAEGHGFASFGDFKSVMDTFEAQGIKVVNQKKSGM